MGYSRSTTRIKLFSLTFLYLRKKLKRIYSSVFLMSLRPNGRPRIESTLYNTLTSINILRATRGVRAGARVKQRAAMLSSQRINTFITTHQRVQSAKYGAGHLATKCINIPTGTRITSEVPKFLITNACHVSNKGRLSLIIYVLWGLNLIWKAGVLFTKHLMLMKKLRHSIAY